MPLSFSRILSHAIFFLGCHTGPAFSLGIRPSKFTVRPCQIGEDEFPPKMGDFQGQTVNLPEGNR